MDRHLVACAALHYPPEFTHEGGVARPCGPKGKKPPAYRKKSISLLGKQTALPYKIKKYTGRMYDHSAGFFSFEKGTAEIGRTRSPLFLRLPPLPAGQPPHQPRPGSSWYSEVLDLGDLAQFVAHQHVDN